MYIRCVYGNDGTRQLHVSRVSDFIKPMCSERIAEFFISRDDAPASIERAEHNKTARMTHIRNPHTPLCRHGMNNAVNYRDGQIIFNIMYTRELHKQ